MSQQNQQGKSAEQNAVVDVINQLGEQKPPTNEQISDVINKTQQFLEEKKNDPEVSQKSIKVLSDFQGVLEATEQFNKNKNPDEALQKVFMETGAAGKEIAEAGQHSSMDTSLQQKGKQLQEQGKQLQEQGKQLSQAVWSVLKEMVGSADFRLQIASLLDVFQDLLYRGTPSSSQQMDWQTENPWKDLGDQGDQTESGWQEVQYHHKKKKQGDTTSNKLSEENKRQISHQFLLVLRKLNQTPEFRSGLRQIVDLFHNLANEQTYSTYSADPANISWEQMKNPQNQLAPELQSSSNLPPEIKQIKQIFQESEHVDTAFEESKKLVERFTKRPINNLLEKNQALFRYIRDNQGARDWFDRVTDFLKDALEKPHQLDDYEFSKKAEDIINRGDEIANDPQLNEKYRQVQDELKMISDAIQNDPDLQLLRQSSQRFLDNFTTIGSDGQRTFNADVMKDLQSLFVPLLIAQLDRIPLPPVSGSNEDYDYHFDGMTLYGQEILPDKIKFHSETDAEFNLQQLETKEAKNLIFLEIANIRTKVDDIHFKITKKTFPSLTDEGIANVGVEGDEGFSLKIKLSVEMNDQGVPRFNLKKVDANIQTLTVRIVEANHPLLLKIFALFYQTKMKILVQENIEEKIRAAFEKIETGMNDVFARFPPSNLKAAISQKTSDALFTNQQSTNDQQQKTGLTGLEQQQQKTDLA